MMFENPAKYLVIFESEPTGSSVVATVENLSGPRGVGKNRKKATDELLRQLSLHLKRQVLRRELNINTPTLQKA